MTVQVRRKAVVVPRTKEIVNILIEQLRTQSAIIVQTLDEQDKDESTEYKDVVTMVPEFMVLVATYQRQAAEALEDLV
jgi:hypothetical protein